MPYRIARMNIVRDKSTTNDYADRVALTRIAVIDPATHNEALCVLSLRFVRYLRVLRAIEVIEATLAQMSDKARCRKPRGR